MNERLDVWASWEGEDFAVPRRRRWAWFALVLVVLALVFGPSALLWSWVQPLGDPDDADQVANGAAWAAAFVELLDAPIMVLGGIFAAVAVGRGERPRWVGFAALLLAVAGVLPAGWIMMEGPFDLMTLFMSSLGP